MRADDERKKLLANGGGGAAANQLDSVNHLDLPNSALVRHKAGALASDEPPLEKHEQHAKIRQADSNCTCLGFAGNTALRAELRRNTQRDPLPDLCAGSGAPAARQVAGRKCGSSTLIDQLMSLEERRASARCTSLEYKPTAAVGPQQDWCGGLGGDLWRQQAELSQALRGQHGFLMAKLEERKRDLLLVEAAWAQRDLRHAMERLLELYGQGLVFGGAGSGGAADASFRHRSGARLGSLKSALVSDVIGILLLRPKLWSLDLCQLLLPVVVGDLLQQQRVPGGSEGHHVEVALRALRLVLLQQGPLIASTLEAHSSVALGVDLSREERLNKCLACYKLLLEARRLLQTARLPAGLNGARLASLQRELEPLFRALLHLETPSSKSAPNTTTTTNQHARRLASAKPAA